MAAEPLTKPQRDVDDTIFDIVDRHRTFDHNHGGSISRFHRDLLYRLTVATAAGLTVGGLVGAILGMRRG